MARNENTFLRWSTRLIVAAGLGAAAFLAGRLGATELCGGRCESLADFTGLLSQPFPVFGDVLCWVYVVAAVMVFLLWIALSVVPVHSVLALLLLVGMTMLGALFGREDAGATDVAAVIEPVSAPVVSAVAEAPAILDLPVSVVSDEPLCPEGNFFKDEGCLSCTVSRAVPPAPTLYFSALRFEAAWHYANDQTYAALDDEASSSHAIDDLVIDGAVSAGGQALCASGAILVIGSASSDGDRDRNEARAERRARRLSSQVAQSCPQAPLIFAMTLGQSVASSDAAVDRALTVIALDTPDGAIVDQAMLEAELGFVLDAGTHGSRLLDRYAAFPQDRWEWVVGASGEVDADITSRPFETRDVLRDDAPESCLAF